MAVATCGGGGDGCVPTACEEIACGAVVACGDSVVTASADDAGPPPSPEKASVVAPPAAEPAPTPLADVPELETIDRASATEPSAAVDAATSGQTVPADEPEPAEPETDVVGEDVAEMEVTEEAEPVPEEPMPEDFAPDEPPTAAQEPEPQPTNIFEEVEAAEVDESESVPFADPAAGEESAELPTAGESVPPEDPPVEAPVIEDVPALEPDSEDEPSVSPADEAAVEPLRRWIDASASFAVVGRLVAVRGETIAIATADGRHVTVPIAVLSDFDRGYVAVAGPRVAAGQARRPQPHETASR